MQARMPPYPAPTLPQDQAASPRLLALRQFVDDELLRAPLLFDQVVDGSADAMRKAMATAGPMQAASLSDLCQALRRHRIGMSEYFVHSLREQCAQELQRSRLQPAHAAVAPRVSELSLVDEDAVALDVELAHAVETVRSVAEHELKELQTYVAALVGDMDMAHDHNPLRPETFSRALWAATHALPLSRGHQMLYLRHAALPMAQTLRLSFAATCARLEERGIEPAAYRTLILPSGSRRSGRSVQTTFSPELSGMRHTMSGRVDEVHTTRAPVADSAVRTPLAWRDVARQAATHAERQSVELVSRLFDAILEDDRVPEDMQVLIARLHAPALGLTLVDGSMLDQDAHPLWAFLNRLVYEAEMTPDPADPERRHLLKLARAVIEQLRGEPAQTPSLYGRALQRLEASLQQRLARRLASLSSQVAALHTLEDKLSVGNTVPTTLAGTLDMPQLDTVPAELIADASGHEGQVAAEAWLRGLSAGTWVRMFIQGRWVRAQLLWPGDRQEIWLFGDGASDATWAVRRRALLAMHTGGLMKTLKQRSLVRSAAARLQRQLRPARSA